MICSACGTEFRGSYGLPAIQVCSPECQKKMDGAEYPYYREVSLVSTPGSAVLEGGGPLDYDHHLKMTFERSTEVRKARDMRLASKHLFSGGDTGARFIADLIESGAVSAKDMERLIESARRNVEKAKREAEEARVKAELAKERKRRREERKRIERDEARMRGLGLGLKRRRIRVR